MAFSDSLLKGLKRCRASFIRAFSPFVPLFFFISIRLLGRAPTSRRGAVGARTLNSAPWGRARISGTRRPTGSLPSGAPAAGPGLDGRVVQGGRLKFSSLRRRGFEPHSSHMCRRASVFFFSPGPPRAVRRVCSSVVEHRIADPAVASSTLVAP